MSVTRDLGFEIDYSLSNLHRVYISYIAMSCRATLQAHELYLQAGHSVSLWVPKTEYRPIPGGGGGKGDGGEG